MNDAQRLWWRQASSDYALFLQLRHLGADECHLIHYLQMATEKLSKAYFWRAGTAPRKAHIGFVRFLKALRDRRGAEQERVAKSLGFARPAGFESWISNAQDLAYALQNIAPAEARDGPNREYPWPHHLPLHCPAEHKFDLWAQLQNTGRGRKLMNVTGLAITTFDVYA